MARPELYALNAADWDYEYSAMMRNQKPGETYPSLTPFYVVVVSAKDFVGAISPAINQVR